MQHSNSKTSFNTLLVVATLCIVPAMGHGADQGSVVPDESVLRGEQLVRALDIKERDAFIKSFISYDRSAIKLGRKRCELESGLRTAERNRAITDDLAASFLKEYAELERGQLEVRIRFADELRDTVPLDRVAVVALAIKLTERTAICPGEVRAR
jgi:hypothetical protein